MGEIKSVKVDNWGVFFLQKLQNFFNKTDYCDLTLQFRDNSQLKVHRLVLSACTDYFNVLEQTCEVVDDAIIMPNGLQADVVVPIVNFMYTGTLEFELKMYNRLLRTAKDMNMTVLLKLLEAHRRTMEMHPQKNQAPTSPKARRKVTPPNTAGAGISSASRSLIQTQPNKRIVVSGNALQQQHRIAPPNAYTRLANSAVVGNLPVKQQIGSTTFTRIKQESELEGNVGGGGYTLLKKSPMQPMTTSPFEQLRKAYTNNSKRPAPTTFISPPAKKPNLEDVKEFAEQQRMRKQIAAEYGDDGDYDTGIMDDDTIHNDDDDDDMAGLIPTAPQPGIAASSSSSAVQASSPQQPSEDPPGTTTIIVKHEGPDKPPTIVVKDSSNSKMNHAKIISEVLRQYPHLVNSNKNIKLKIMPNTGGQTQKVIVKKEASAETEKTTAVVSSTVVAPKLPTLPKVEAKGALKSTAVTGKEKQQSGSNNNTTTVGETSSKVSGTTATTATAVASQKRRIDSKTMHALIALGAENISGPWLCLRCGRNGHPISIPSYRGFRRHLINTHKEAIDPALCEHCGWRSSTKRELHFHMQLEHKVRTNLYIFPDCQLCHQMCIDSDALNQHLIDSHPDENKQQCIYCNKIFPEELQLYTHMKTFHKKQALEDGIIDYSDDENTNIEPVFPPPEEDEMTMEEEHEEQQQPEKKIKILSDISLPIASSIIKTDSFVTENVTAGESTTSVTSEEYLHDQEHVETKFVAADGSEVILTDEQRKEILSQLNQENEGSGVVMVLNENQQFAGGETQSEQGAISHDETSQTTTATNDDQEHDDNQIYNELKSHTPGAIEEDTTSQPETDAGNHEQQDEHQIKEDVDEKVHHEHLDESKESIDNLEWAENLISEHEMADEIPETPTEASSNYHHSMEEEPKEEYKSQDDISNKLKELAGEWSEDEDEEMPEEAVKQKPNENVENVEKELETADNTEIASIDTEKEKDDVDDKPDSKIDEPKEDEESTPPIKEKLQQEDPEIVEDVEKPIVADDVDLALKCLHKEDDDDKRQIDDVPENPIEETKESKHEKENITEFKKEDDDKVDEVKSEDQNSPIKGDSALNLDAEETKKDIIDTLKSEHEDDTASKGATAENDAEKSVDTQGETVADSATGTTSKSTTDEPAIEDEFLDVKLEKLDDSKDEPSATAISTEKDTNPSTTLANTPISSEDRVKSLISEWGDDDDEDDNENENTDTDLRGDL